MEVQPRHLGAVAELELVPGPAGVEEGAVEDAVIDDQLADGSGDALGDGCDEELEELLDGDALLVAGGDHGQELGVAESGVAVADDDEAIALEHDAGFEGEVRPQHVQGGAGGEQFHVAGGDHGLAVVDADQRAIGVGVADGDGDGGAAKPGLVDGAGDLVRQVRPCGQDQGEHQQGGEQGEAARSEHDGFRKAGAGRRAGGVRTWTPWRRFQPLSYRTAFFDGLIGA